MENVGKALNYLRRTRTKRREDFTAVTKGSMKPLYLDSIFGFTVYLM